MAEGRMIKKEISDSKKLGRLSSDRPRVLYFMMLPHLDVVGRLYADPKKIKGQIVTMLPYSVISIQKALEQLHEVGLIVLYQINGDQFLEFTRFGDFQKLYPNKEAESKILPPTPENSGGLRRTPLKDKISKDKIREEKTRFLKFVLLTKDEHQKLIQRYGPKPAQALIDDLDYYITNKKGRDPYTDHYRTLCKWAKKDNIPELHKDEKDESAALEKKRQEILAKYAWFKTAEEKKLIAFYKNNTTLRWVIKELRPEIAGKAQT